MGRLLQLIFLIGCISVSGQSNAIFFSEALDVHLPKYIQEAEVAIRERQQDKVKLLFDKLVEEALVGTYMDNFEAMNLSKNIVAFEDFEKPTLLLTYTSWCIPSKGELPALNELAKAYKKEVDIVVLFWDKHKTVRKVGRDFNSHITVLYADEMNNKSTRTIKNLKHSLGLPLVFTLDSKKEIINIQRRIANSMKESNIEAFEKNHTLFKEEITKLLYHEAKIKGEPLVTY